MTRLPGSTFASRNAARLTVLASGMTPRRARPIRPSLTSTAAANSTFPSAPRPGTPGSGPPRKLWSTSTSPRNRSRPGRTITVRQRCSIAHAVWTEPSSISRRSWVAETPVTAVDHQPGRGEPHGQRCAGLVEDGACGGGDLPLAGATQPPGVGQPPPMAAAATGTDEPVWPADPVQVVQALPVLIEPGRQLRVGARVVPPGRRAHAGYSTLQEYLNGDPFSWKTKDTSHLARRAGSPAARGVPGAEPVE